MNFIAAKSHVANRGEPPDDFLSALIAWGKKQDDSLFEVNAAHDIYSLIAPTLGPWTGILHRRAAMLEAMRVHAGFESSWKWTEGKDPDNDNPDPKSWETGIFQVSFDSTDNRPSLKAYLASVGASTLQAFDSSMKIDPDLIFGYYARLVRIDITWAGPLASKKILPWLKREAVAEFEAALVQGSADAQPA